MRLEKAPHAHLPPLHSGKPQGFYVRTGDSEFVIVAVYKSPVLAWSDANITETLNFRIKSLLGGDLNGKNPVWNGQVSNPKSKRLLELFEGNFFQISGPPCPIHYTLQKNGEVLCILLHKNVPLLDVIFSINKHSDHLSIIFHILHSIRTRDVANRAEK